MLEDKTRQIFFEKPALPDSTYKEPTVQWGIGMPLEVLHIKSLGPDLQHRLKMVELLGDEVYEDRTLQGEHWDS